MISTPKRTWMAAGAIVAWIWFILACVSPPAWNPDGSKLLFIYQDSGSKKVGVGILDVRSGTTASLYEHEANNTLLYAQWASDGKRAIVVRTNEDTSEKSVLFVAPGEDAREMPLHIRSRLETSPFVEADGKLLIPTEDVPYAFDLQTGELSKFKFPGFAPCFFSGGAKATYVRKATRTFKDRPDNIVEFGDFDPRTLKLTPRSVFRWSRKKLNGSVIQDMDGCGVIDRNGRRMAIALHTAETPGIALLSEGRVETFALPAKTHMADIAWSDDGESLYLADAHVEGNGTIFQIIECAADGKILRTIPLTTLAFDDSKDLEFYLRMSLSPDGKTLAVNSAVLPVEATGTTGLAVFLVDVKTERVRTVPVRLPMQPVK